MKQLCSLYNIFFFRYRNLYYLDIVNKEYYVTYEGTIDRFESNIDFDQMIADLGENLMID